MMTILNFIRKKTTKIYIVILTVTIFAIFLLASLINYFSKLQNEIFYECTDLLIVNDYDIYDDLSNIEGIENLNRILVFRENKNYDVFVNSNYNSNYYNYDSNGNLISSDTSNDTENKIIWNAVERDEFEENIVVYSAGEFGYEMGNTYNEEVINNMIDKKIVFFFNDNNIEFSISNVIRVDKSFLLVSDELYDKLTMESSLYSYQANIISYKEQSMLKNEIKKISNRFIL